MLLSIGNIFDEVVNCYLINLPLNQVQKKQDKEWIDVKTIADDLSISNPRTISPGGYLDLKEVFSSSGGYNPTEEGVFRLSVSFLRSDGKIMLDNQKSLIQVYSVFKVNSQTLSFSKNNFLSDKKTAAK